MTATSRNLGHARVVSILPGRIFRPRGIENSKPLSARRMAKQCRRAHRPTSGRMSLPCSFCGGERWTHTSNDFCRNRINHPWPMDRPCGPGLTATATGAARIVIDGINIVLAGDREDICGLQNSYPRGRMNPTDSATKAYRKTPMRHYPVVKLGSLARSMVSLQHCLKQASAILPSRKSSSRRKSDWSAGAHVPIIFSVPAQSRFANLPSRLHQVARGIVLRHGESTGGP